jgi:UDP-N-acetylglucosamine 2-epimerase (non-hydrolysing)
MPHPEGKYMKKVLCVFGTRPEAVKMCPVINELKNHNSIKTVLCLTGQHKEMLLQVMNIFGINGDYYLDVMRQNQTLTTITVDVLERFEKVLIDESPDIVLVHGDTTSSFAAAIAAFYQKIPVGHIEAGLRTYNKYSPYPEEMNRSLTSRIAELHFAPTKNNEQNLIKEGVTTGIFITGNTVIDALKTTIKENYHFKTDELNTINFSATRVILVTAHRRENLGKPLENICRAIYNLSNDYQDITIIFPVHLNPVVQKTVRGFLENKRNIHLIDPVDVEEMHNILSRSYLVMTDSGGLQEEAPSCGVPVLVLRKETERPEAVSAGTLKVTGVEEDDIYQAAKLLLDEKEEYAKMAHAVNPYGDGQASKRIVEAVLEYIK